MPGVTIFKEPTKHDRICSDHFITGKPSNDPLHPDYVPTLKMISTKTPTRITRGTLRKKRLPSDDLQKRKEAANALLTMTKAQPKPKRPQHKQRAIQTDPDPRAILDQAKLNHLEKEIALLQRINSQLRAQRQGFEDALKRSLEMADEAKKRKLDQGAGDQEKFDNSNCSLFNDFTVKKVLREDPRSKTISLYGSLTKGEHKSADAVVLLERKPFEVPTVEESLHKTRTSETLSNDIYSTHDGFSPGLSADLKVTVICPCTEKHISKYSEHEPFLVRETPELYKTVTEPCMAQSKFSIQWVYNILEKKTESERIVEEDPDPDLGFVLLPDMKWDRKNVDQLYLVAIAHKHGLRSLRDLGSDHLPLLENIRTKALAAIKEKFGVASHQMRVYLHYQPSYYHLHVHFTNLRLDSPPGSDVLRAHLLDDVIDNIRSDPEFYQRTTISYALREGDELFKWYKKAGYFGTDEGQSQNKTGESESSTVVINLG
ncbi:hypothetical protein EGW08_007136 [Elysia chlorotica]|uniref:m7GpppX diphosphatase n=1 Tax=Elysia chlorotica TaxID=188477 RepID=A0A433TU53_ELYCH|nr:hypothetical protein EGW08_007136 [Elysia chlorotica]